MSDAGGSKATRRARVTVAAEQAGLRLDQVLATLVPELSRRLARKVLAMGAVQVNGKPVRIASWQVRGGEVLTATWHPEVLVPERYDLVVVHEDADVIVVDKPAGQLSQGSELGDTGSLIHALQRRFGPSVRLMHRLDKGASGLLVAGRHPDATAALTPQFREHTIERRYLAVTQGVPADGVCEVPIVKVGRTVRAGLPGEDGIPARSEVMVKQVVDAPVGAVGSRALVEVKLYTGRTHQIRIHLSALGAPIVGDTEYGGPPPTAGAARVCLHAATLAFTTPAGQTLAFERAPGPDFWAAAGPGWSEPPTASAPTTP